MKKNKFLVLFALILLGFLPFGVNAIEILVQTPEEDLSLQVESSDTIEAVKEKIFNKNNNYLINNQKLYYDDEELIDGRTLGDYEEIGTGSTIKLEIVEDVPVNVILNANGGIFVDNKEEYTVEDFYGTSEEFVYPTREGYVFKGYYTEKDGGLNISCYLDNNVIKEEMTFYAHWDVVGTTTIDFTKIINDSNFTDLELALLNVLFNNGTLVVDETDSSLKNKSGKTLVEVDDEGYITVAEDVTLSDNLIYTLSDEEKNQILDFDIKINYVPDKLELIFAKEEIYKVIFDANEGKFKNGNVLTIEKWENGLENSLEKPTRDGYKFLGYFTEKTGGTKLELILAESGINNDMTFYAQWEQNSVIAPAKPGEENPKTFDGITNSIVIGAISLIGLIGATIYLKKKNKVRA